MNYTEDRNVIIIYGIISTTRLGDSAKRNIGTRIQKQQFN